MLAISPHRNESSRQAYSSTVGGRLALLGTLLLIVGLTSCNRKEPNEVNPDAMASIKRLSLANLQFEKKVLYVGAAEGEVGGDFAGSLVPLDVKAVIDRVSTSHAFQVVRVLEKAGTKDSVYAKALSDPLSADPIVIANLTKQNKVDGLMWIHREYRVRASRSFGGDRYAEWTAEVLSHIYVFDNSGHLVLRVTWLDQGDAKHEGKEISGDQIVTLLAAAINRAAETSASILAAAVAGKGIPEDLHGETNATASHWTANIADWFGNLARIGLLAFLIWAAYSTLASDRIGAKGLGVLVSAGVLYLLFGRGWWKEALDFVLGFFD
jgi:hypothetical protein